MNIKKSKRGGWKGGSGTESPQKGSERSGMNPVMWHSVCHTHCGTMIQSRDCRASLSV